MADARYYMAHSGKEIDDAVNRVLAGTGAGTGADGYSPTAKVEQTADGAVITITDKDGTTTATVTNGVSPDKSEIVTDVLAELPITTDSGYTDISGLRQATAVSMTKTENAVAVDVTLQGGVAYSSVVTLDDDGYPVQIVTDGVDCAVSWEGFD